MLLLISSKSITNGLINKFMKPAITQISFLSDILQRDEKLQRHFDMDHAFDKLINIRSYKLYRYVLYLHINNKRFKLNTVLKQLGFKARKI